MQKKRKVKVEVDAYLEEIDGMLSAQEKRIFPVLFFVDKIRRRN